jgi:hypothetical protein
MIKKFIEVKAIFFVVVALMLLLSACTGTGDVEDLRTESETVALDNADAVVAEISMGAGELTLQGGAQALMEAEFTYNVAVWRPEVDYSVDESGDENVGRLFVSQPAEVEFDSNLTNFRYQWEVHLNNEVPIDLRVELGAGNANIDAIELDLTALDVAAGAGNITVDLSGERQRDLAASIRGGVGNLTVLLPSEAGVKVDVTGGLGQVVATGLSRNEDGSFVNAAFDTAENTIVLDIQGGVGEINLEVVE